MGISKILSVLLISTVAACSGAAEKTELTQRSPEERCLELENRWDVAQQSLVKAEGRYESSWLYHVADTFNPLTNGSDDNLKLAKTQEQRASENYMAFGCMDLNKLQINSAFKSEVPVRNKPEEDKVLPPVQETRLAPAAPAVNPVSYQQSYSQGYNQNPYAPQQSYNQGYDIRQMGSQQLASQQPFAQQPQLIGYASY